MHTLYGPAFEESVAKADLHYEVHQQDDPFEQIAVAALGIGLSVWLGPQMSALVGEAFGATAGTFMGAAGTVEGVAVSAGVGNMVVAGTLTGMATSSATQLVATGTVDFGAALKSGLSIGLTAGLSRGLGEAIGNESLVGGKLVDAGNGRTIVVAADGATGLADKLVGYTVRAATSAGVNQIVYGRDAGGAGNDFLNSLISSTSADAANWIGANVDRQANPVGNVGAHALVGCAAAAAMGSDCGAGALGAAAAASLNPLLDQLTSVTDSATRNAQLAALSTAAAGFLAYASGQDIQTTINASQNETLNNYLTRSQKSQMLREVESCGDLLCKAGAYSQYGVVSANQEVALLQGIGIGALGQGYEIVDGLLHVAKDIPGTVRALRELITSEDAIGQLTYETVQEYKQRLDQFEQNYETGGFGGAFDAGVEAGRLIVDAVGLASTIGGTAKLDVHVGIKVAERAAVIGERLAVNGSVVAERTSIGQAHVYNNFYRDGSPVDIGPHFEAFESGGSYLVPLSIYESRIVGKPTIGRPDGQFITTRSAMDRLLSETGGDLTLINQRLGTNWNESLIRVDVKDVATLNQRLPTGFEQGADRLRFQRGGYTSGGMPEIVIDRIPVENIMISPVDVKGIR